MNNLEKNEILIFKICRKKSLGGGILINLGIYAIQCCQWVMQQSPISITASGTLNDDGVDVEVEATIDYGDSKVGTLKVSALSEFSNVATIVGTKGQITVS